MTWVQPGPVPRGIRRVLIGLGALVISIALVVAGIAGYIEFNSDLPFPSDSQLADQVAALGKTIPLLNRLDVTEVESRLGCKALKYGHGIFTDDRQFGCGLLNPASTHPFDLKATADFDAIHGALNATGIGVMTVAYAPASDQVSSGYSFSGSCALCPILNYVYDPGYTVPLEVPQERLVAVNADWYVWQDLDRSF